MTHKHHSRKAGNPTNRVVPATPDEIRRFSGTTDSEPGGIRRGSSDLIGAMGGRFEKTISAYSDRELEQLERRLGRAGLMRKITEEAFFGERLLRLKAKMRAERNSQLSPEVEDFFDDVRARSILRHGLSMKVEGMDDRLGENLDICLALFRRTLRVQSLGKESEVEKFLREIKVAGEEDVGGFLMRTPSEYLKLLIYYCHLSGFGDIRQIIEAHRKMPRFPNSREHPEDRVYQRDPISYICSIREDQLETLMRTLNISSMNDYLGFFFSDPEFVLTVSRSSFLLDNLTAIMEKFGMRTNVQLRDFVEFARKAGVLETLTKAASKNLNVLLAVSLFRNPAELCDALRKPETADSLVNADYSVLQDLMDALSSDEKKKSEYLRHLLKEAPVKNIEAARKLLGAVKGMRTVPPSMVDLAYDALKANGQADESVRSLSFLIVSGKLWKEEDAFHLTKLMDFSGGVLTAYLGERVIEAPDKEGLITGWRRTLMSFESGKFDPADELHRQLEYIRFRRIIDSEKVRKHVKSGYTYSDYEKIFQRRGSQTALSPKDSFEVECVAHEAKRLMAFILEADEAAKRSGRRTMVIPNLSYGYLPVSVLVDELRERGIEVVIGAKVGSSDCHDNPDCTNSRLFKGHRKGIVKGEPVIVVVDGTKHMVDDRANHRARYPDAYQGYLNQVIALNDSCGFRDNDYSDAGKTESGLVSLRADPEFRRTVRVYGELRPEGAKAERYGFGFWNSSGMKFAIRNQREEVLEIEPVKPSEIRGPILIFANPSVLDEQIPEEIRTKYKAFRHEPAYFDDSGRIIAFDFGYDNYGVRYLNRLETAVRKAYGTPAGPANVDTAVVSGIMRAISKGLQSTEGEEGAAVR